MKETIAIVLAMGVFLLPVASYAGQRGDSGSSKSSTSTTQSSTTQSAATPASAIASCGIKPPPPIGFWPDDAVCLCDGKKCKWVWMKR